MSEILKMVREHNEYRSKVLNLQASENILSSAVREALGSDLASRYSLVLSAEEGDAYGGTRYTAAILDRTEKLASTLYGSKYAEVRPIGGHIAAETVMLSLLRKRENLMSIAERDGGYTGYQNNYLSQMLGVHNYEIPYDSEKQEIILDRLEDSMRATNPSLLVLGQSFFLRHYDLKPVRELCDKYGSYLVYDGSHVMGLIGGRAFQPDVLKYCDVLFGSTHKSLFGPQGGMILTNSSEIIERVRKNITWRTMDNYHPSRIAALGIALEEMNEFGPNYAESVVRNSRTLGKALYDRGFGVRFSPWFSETHQLGISGEYLTKIGLNFASLSEKLEENHIIIDREGRIGTSEISRMGLTDVDSLAGIIIDAAKGKDVRREADELLKPLRIHYTGA